MTRHTYHTCIFPFCLLACECMAVPPENRVKCAGTEKGITQAECEARGCCFDNWYPKTVQCFQPDPGEYSSVSLDRDKCIVW